MFALIGIAFNLIFWGLVILAEIFIPIYIIAKIIVYFSKKK